MAETVQMLRCQVTITALVTGDDGARKIVDINKDIVFTDGTGSNQIGNVWHDETRPLNATNETLDIDALTDFQGASMSTTNNVKVMFAENKSTTTGEVLTLFGGDFSTPMGDASDKIKVGPGGFLLLVSPVDGYAVTASTGDGLLVAHSGNSSYQILLGVDNT